MIKDYEKKIFDTAGKDPGFRVPDGYFESTFSAISERLPERKKVVAPRLNMWQKIRPYVYMAAMFAGIWLMMRVFHTATTSDLSLDNMPGDLVAWVQEDGGIDDNFAVEVSGVDEYDDFEEVADSYTSIDDFENDFGYKLKSQYADMQL